MSSNENETQQPRTLRVTLAEVPTDVLVWLVDNDEDAWKLDVIAEAVAPSDVSQLAARAFVCEALDLLSTGGWIERSDLVGGPRWWATTNGCDAVRRARLDAKVSR